MNETFNTQEQVFSPEDIEKNKVISFLAYLIFFIPLIAAPDSKFARFHANQGLILLIFSLAIYIIGSVTTVIFIGFIILFIGWIPILVFAIMGIINALNGQAKPLPLIGKFTILK
ncbi:MAG: hypothetical protein N2319_10240 [Candidatus Kapabacteria bacterium]|nr:hypothetical protein [Candidatus Kapabacteria bacterium]